MAVTRIPRLATGWLLRVIDLRAKGHTTHGSVIKNARPDVLAEECRRVKRLLKESEKQIPRGLKSARDDSNK